MENFADYFEVIMESNKTEKEFLNMVIYHKEPICPKCHIGRIVCPEGKVKNPHYFHCTNNCGWYVNIDYNDCIVE